MKKSIVTVFGAMAILSIAACSTATPRSLPPGEYTRTEKSVDRYGTETKTETKTDVYYDEYGNKRAVKKTEMSSDPEGLFNKNTSTTIDTYN